MLKYRVNSFIDDVIAVGGCDPQKRPMNGDVLDGPLYAATKSYIQFVLGSMSKVGKRTVMKLPGGALIVQVQLFLCG